MPLTLPRLPHLPPPPRIPDFRLPAVVGRLATRLPQWPHGVLLALLLDLARRRGLLPESDLATLEGRRFRIVVSDLGAQADFSFRDGRFQPASDAGEPDLAFRADCAAYLQMITRQEDPDTLFFNRRLDIAGDTELGLAVKNMLDAVDVFRV